MEEETAPVEEEVKAEEGPSVVVEEEAKEKTPDISDSLVEISPEEIIKSMDVLTDLLASKIVLKMSSGKSGTQNGFKTVNKLANVLGSS